MWSVIFLILFSILCSDFCCILFSFVLAFLLFFFKFNFSSFGGLLYLSRIFYLDDISFYFIFLTFILFLFIIFLEFSKFSYLFIFLINSLFLSIVLVFSSKSALYFFIFFESSFVFISIVVLLWGYNPERINALSYFLIYSILGSAPLLFVIIASQNIIWIGIFFWNDALTCSTWNDYNRLGRHHYLYGIFDEEWYPGFIVIANEPKYISNLLNNKDSYFFIYLLYFFYFFLFLIKFPIFGFHNWLPKAHVEAPISGSMILAGILIKLGIFGIFRFYNKILYNSFVLDFTHNIYYYSCFTLILVNFICSRQFDLKSFVAYSSIVHMSLVIFSIWSNSLINLIGSIFLSFSHGICSASLFLSVNLYYLISKSRSIFINRGFLFLTPLLSLFFFLFSSSNCSWPLSLNFFSEYLLIISGYIYNSGSCYILMFNIFMTGLYSMFIYIFTSHGKLNLGLNYSVLGYFSFSYFLILTYYVFILYFYFVSFNSFTHIL